MAAIGRRGLVVATLAVAMAGTPAAAWGWHIEGTVLCDENLDGIPNGGDSPVPNVTVRLTTLTTVPGTAFEGTTGGTGFYSRALPDYPEDYRVELVGGLPPGASVVGPTSGAYGVPPVAAIALTGSFKHATGIDFLLTGCASAATPSPSATPTTSAVPSETAVPSATVTAVETPLELPTPTTTVTPTEVATPTVTPTEVATPTVTATATPDETATPTGSPTATPTDVATATPTATTTPVATPTATPIVTATPEPSATPTPVFATATPTPDSTPGTFASIFQCYEIDRSTLGKIEDLPVEDRYGLGLVDVAGRGKVKRLCNPASLDGQNPGALADPNHLVGYVVTGRTPRGERIPDQMVTNVFGTTHLTVLRPIALMVPSAKSLIGPPAPLAPAAVDHFQCYAVGSAGKTRVDDRTIVDQFGTKTMDVKRPSRLCVAADKRGEGVLDASAALMCYQVRTASGGTPFRGVDGPVYVANQFGADTLMVTRPTELCVPSTVTAQRKPSTRRGRR